MNQENIAELIKWYEQLNLLNLNQINNFYSQDAYFRDPFHELFDLKSLILLYEDMFKKIDNPRFTITNTFTNEKELVLFWDFKFIAFKKEMIISGNTLFKFNSEGKINYHLDYWDSVSELWNKTPVLGKIIRTFYKIIF
ncbi:MAG: nuclear transport factor 2 family protein [Bacteriovorax sp.]|nr:nuclear transport factor 2 family protein [Bacteriovorax sp.]